MSDSWSPADVAAVVTASAVLAGCIYWAGQTNASVRDLKELARDIRQTLDQILLSLPPATTYRRSPIRLTSLGEKIAEDLSVRPWAAEVVAKENLVQAVRGKQQFEIFEECERRVESQMAGSEVLERRIRKGAYDHGLDVAAVKRVYAVVLRDVVMDLLGPAS